MYPLLKTIIISIQIVTQYYNECVYKTWFFLRHDANLLFVFSFCESSFSPKHAHLYLLIADYLFVGGALGATIRFYRRLRHDCAPIHKPGAKIYSFIGIVIFQLIQNVSNISCTYFRCD